MENLPPKPKTSNELYSTAAFPRTPSRVDPNNPPWPAYRGKYNLTVDSHSMTDRVPVALYIFLLLTSFPLPSLLGYHEYSFAYATMGKRLPTILGKAIEDVIRTLNEQVSCAFLFVGRDTFWFL